MNSKYNNLFNTEPREGLATDILAYVRKSEQRSAKARFFGLAFLSLILFGVLSMAAIYLWGEMQTTGFIDYFRLLLGGAISNFWVELTLALLESLPAFYLLLFFSVLVSLISSIRFTLRNYYLTRISFS